MNMTPGIVLQISHPCLTNSGTLSYMATDSLSYTLRIPNDLRRLLDSSAKSGGVSMASLMIEACWKHLERDSSVVERRAHNPEVVGSTPATKPDLPPQMYEGVTMNPAMAKFMQTVPIPAAVVETEVPAEVRRCINPTCDSSLRLARGKWSCTDQFCGLFGVEQKVKR